MLKRCNKEVFDLKLHTTNDLIIIIRILCIDKPSDVGFIIFLSIYIALGLKAIAIFNVSLEIRSKKW